MKIALVAHIRHAIAEPFMGGMEAHCASLADGLAARGHQITLLAAPGPERADLVPICDAPYEAVLPWEQWRGTDTLDAYQRAAFARAWELIRQERYDVVHNNSLFPELIDWARCAGIPCVTSQHVPPFGRMREAVGRAAGVPHAQITVTSASQLPLWFDAPPPNMRVVHNGIAVNEWSGAAQRGDQLVWFGRITPNKGLADAVAAVRAAGARLDIVGQIEDPSYFAAHVAPFLHRGIQYRGHLSGAALRAAVGAARAALVTPCWDEPFGLVAAEAMAAGLPVIAYDRGAMREVIGPCGILVPPGDVAGLAEAIGGIGAIDPAACRARARARFSREAMIRGYEEAYRAAIAGVPASAAACSSSASTAALLA